VFYDALLPEMGWSLARAQTAIYHRVAYNLLLSSGQRFKSEPLNAEELARHRPDLPLRMLRSREANWNAPVARLRGIDTDFEVQIPRLALIPYGPKGAPQKPFVIEAANDRSFTGHELLVSAHRS
jgi:hypothetical protein